MRLLAYARQSKSDRDRVPSTEWQLAEIERRARERGHTILASFADVKSGYRNVVRPEFDRLLDAMAAPDVDGAIVWRLDRLSRKGQWGEDVIRFMEAKGDKALLSVLEDVDTTTAAGELVLGVRLSLAKGVSEAISQQWVRAKRQAAEAGQPASGGHRWFGWTRDFQLEPDEARLLGDAADRMLSGGSLRGIVLTWNADGISTSTGRSWTTRSLRQTLRSYRLAGLREWGGKLVLGSWPAILDRDTVDRLRRLLDDPARRPGAPTLSLLGGLLRCWRCDSSLRAARATTGKRRYQCPPPPEGCGGCATLAEPLEREIGARLVAYLVDLGTEPPRPDLAPVISALETAESHQAELAEDYYDRRSITKAQFRRASDALTARIGTLKAQAAAAERTSMGRTLAGDPATLGARWVTMSDEDKRAVISTYLDYVTVLPATKGTKFDPDRFKPKWS